MKRLALVTGAANGLGKSIAERLGRDDVTVVIGDIDHDAARHAAEALGAAGLSAIALPLDVSDEDSVASTYAEIERRFGRLDALINNAGVIGLEEGQRARVEETSLATWERTMNVNLGGTFLMCRGAIPLMRRGGYGRIVNISSRSARARTGLNNCSYAASKTAILGFSRVLAGEVGHDGITVNCVAPSRVITPMTLSASDGESEYFERAVRETSLGRLAMPADIADAVAFLCSDGAAFITGSVVDVNGGSFMP
ncbi:SDR family NAD(P)-dependent oxidoreductase [Caballeronia zhejiangensis]|uniref:SDR family NAD(P)-dependent oxidoreductase n=1 Tax=Caballeronia zhejiangensis TaxID=871203 RepID=UPI001EF3E070|nr:SDR family NAD(P)-dependent oxidoreductase [Caballeronia zhejiangensis]MCG7400315.1 SDR family oxidoreductase [Caballeronia zhejiangensis]